VQPQGGTSYCLYVMTPQYCGMPWGTRGRGSGLHGGPFNKALCRRHYEEVLGAKQLDVVDEIYADQVAYCDGHRSKIDLRDVFCFQEQRMVSRDWVVQFERHLYQIPADIRRGQLQGRKSSCASGWTPLFTGTGKKSRLRYESCKYQKERRSQLSSPHDRGDISKESKVGTFLSSFDTA